MREEARGRQDSRWKADERRRYGKGENEMKSVFSGSSSRVRARTMYTRCSEREACPFARARVCSRARNSLASTRDLRLPRFFYFLCLSVNLLSLRCPALGCHAKYCRGMIMRRQLRFSLILTVS